MNVGSGDRKMVIIANQHGNEFTVSNSALEIIRALTSNAKGARAIRDALTVTVIPRVNVDGFDSTTTGSPWRQNVDPFTCSPCPAFYANNRGYDINRYHSYLKSDPLDDPNTGPVTAGQGDNPVPEALNVRNAYDAAGGGDKVEVVLDLHHQGTYKDPDGSMVTAATTWRTLRHGRPARDPRRVRRGRRDLQGGRLDAADRDGRQGLRELLASPTGASTRPRRPAPRRSRSAARASTAPATSSPHPAQEAERPRASASD